MRDCCHNCKLRYDLVKFDYSGKGCKHTNMNGFICMLFAHEERKATWMVGSDEYTELCECFTPKEVEENDLSEL